MSEKKLALHAHTYSVSLETYNQSEGLKKNMKIVQTDTWIRPGDDKEIEFIAAMEGANYPVFAFMYHPEYQMLDYQGDKAWPKSDSEASTEEIAYRLSKKINMIARTNSNRPRDVTFIQE